MAAIRRIQQEMREIADFSVKEGVIVRVNEPTDLTCVQAFILSSEEAPTANYIFSFSVQYPRSYPFNPPKVISTNRIWHPKINPETGYMSMVELTPKGWAPHLTIGTILLSIRAMLANPGDFMIGGPVNVKAYNEYIRDRATYNKKALQFAKEDNEGYGRVQFEDLRHSAIHSKLAVPYFVSYEYHVICYRKSTQCFECTVKVIPSLRTYREMINTTEGSHITQGEFKFKSRSVSLTASEDSLDKCWKIKMSNSTFEKSKLDQIDPRKDPAPQCSITIEWVRPEREPERLMHKFCIEDSDDHTEIRSFDLVIEPKSIPSTPGMKAGIEYAENTPTLPQLLHLPVASGQYVNLTVEVGRKYFEFGVQLLDDKTGQKTSNIETQKRGEPLEAINREILMDWLQGKGKPVTWKTLVDVLRRIELNELVEAINTCL